MRWDNSPIRLGLKGTAGVGRPGVPVIDEGDVVADKHPVANGHALADKGVTGYLAVLADNGVFLDLDEAADPRAVADPAAVEVDESKDPHVFSHHHVRRDARIGFHHALSFRMDGAPNRRRPCRDASNACANASPPRKTAADMRKSAGAPVINGNTSAVMWRLHARSGAQPLAGFGMSAVGRGMGEVTGRAMAATPPTPSPRACGAVPRG